MCGYNLRATAKLRLHIKQAIKFTYTTPSTHRKKRQELLEDTADSKFGAENVNDKSETSCHTTKQRSYESSAVLCQKGLDSQPKYIPVDQRKTSRHS